MHQTRELAPVIASRAFHREELYVHDHNVSVNCLATVQSQAPDVFRGNERRGRTAARAAAATLPQPLP